MKTNLPDQYANLTPRELLQLYDGPGALECPPELKDWLDAARKLEDERALRARTAIERARVVVRRLLSDGGVS